MTPHLILRALLPRWAKPVFDLAYDYVARCAGCAQKDARGRARRGSR